jgi:hypothetical protein
MLYLDISRKCRMMQKSRRTERPDIGEQLYRSFAELEYAIVNLREMFVRMHLKKHISLGAEFGQRGDHVE